MKNRFTLLALFVLLSIVIVACQSKTPIAENSPSTKTTPPAVSGEEKPKNTFTMLTSEHANFPYNKDWIIWDWIEEYTGARFDVQLPSGDLSDTINLNVASQSMPDITYFVRLSEANKFGQQGVLVNILDYIDVMPNLKVWMEKYPENIQANLAADGGMYMLPNEGFGETNRVIWMYREDIFEKHDIKTPATYEELIEVARELKKLYPDSYPFSTRYGAALSFLRMAAPQFGTHSTFFLDEQTGELRYGPTEDGYKQMIAYFHQLVKEGLMPPDWLTTNTQQWQNMVSNDQTFMLLDYIGRLDLFNIPMKKTNPDFNLAFMPPPAGVAGFNVNPFIHYIEAGVAVSADSNKITEILQTFDWFFSEEGKEILSWGKGDAVYITENGERKLRDEYLDVTDVRNKTGLATNTTYAWFDYDAHLVPATEEQRAAYDLARQHDSVFRVQPQYNESELNQVSLLQTAVNKHREEQITRFILGERSLDEWEQYVSEAKAAGLDELTKITQAAYDRLQ